MCSAAGHRLALLTTIPLPLRVHLCCVLSPQVDPTVSSSVYYVSSLYHKADKDFVGYYKASLLYLAYVSSESLPADFRLVSLKSSDRRLGALPWGVALGRLCCGALQHGGFADVVAVPASVCTEQHCGGRC